MKQNKRVTKRGMIKEMRYYGERGDKFIEGEVMLAYVFAYGTDRKLRRYTRERDERLERLGEEFIIWKVN